MGLLSYVRGVFHKLINFTTIQQAEQVTTPLSAEMTSALQTWSDLYTNNAKWLQAGKIKSLNLPAFISSELARQVTLEMQTTITGKTAGGDTATEDGEPIETPRALYLGSEFKKLLVVLRQKLEQGCAAGGMIIKPYPADGHLYFDISLDWDIYPLAFDNAGELQDVIIPDFYYDGRDYYTRLERHTRTGDDVTITNKAYKSGAKDVLGKEVPLTSVDRWADLEPEITVLNAEGQLFGWFKVPTANAVDLHTPMGSSCFAKAIDLIKEADEQYSRLLWEFEGSELAIDIDYTAVKSAKDGKYQLPKLSDRLFRAVDLDRGNGDSVYNVFSPAIRDASLLNGLNSILQRIEDLCGISRGTISDANEIAKTATELTIQKQRSYATVADTQKALERCLLDVLRAMDKYCSLYGLAPEGLYDASFDWDDSILIDSETRMTQMLSLMNSGIISKSEFRQWYFNETEAQANAALETVHAEQQQDMDDSFKIRNE